MVGKQRLNACAITRMRQNPNLMEAREVPSPMPSMAILATIQWIANVSDNQYFHLRHRAPLNLRSCVA
jgi:hypothetical protein